jgi:hypothetical protein
MAILASSASMADCADVAPFPRVDVVVHDLGEPLVAE